MIKELKIMNDIYSLPDEKGDSKCLKRGVISKKVINTCDIQTVEHIIDKKGNILKTSCLIKVGEEYFRVKERYEEVSSWIKPIVVKGFSRK